MKVLIVGGVAAGASMAARLRRLDESAEIIMFERGEYISFANCGLPYYVGDVIGKRNQLLVQTPKSMNRRFNIDIRVKSEVRKILPETKQVEVKEWESGNDYLENYDYLVLCPGAAPLVPNLTGRDKPNVFTLRNIPDSDMIKLFLESKKPEKAVVIGGGYIGLEMVEMLDKAGLDIVLVEAAAQVMGAVDPEMAAIVHDYLKLQNVELHLSNRVIELEGDEEVKSVILADGTRIDTDLVVMGVGVTPETKLAREAGLTLGQTGGIWVDEYLRTSDPFIYAAGDAIQVTNLITGEDSLLPMASPANRQGWLVANNIAGRALKYSGVQGTAIVKIMRLTAAVTGRNEKTLRNLGIDYETCHLFPAAHATYYPGSTELAVKILFRPDDGKLLGAQIIGYEGVDKRIDVLATAIRAGMNVFDLQELELAYAPPFSSAKDPVNMAGYAAGNAVRGDVRMAHWEDIAARVKDGAFLLDVRTPQEVKDGMVEKAFHIPVDELRTRLEELPKDQDILVYCRSGLRSYVACRILSQAGYRCENIDGGYKLYSIING
jgi:NADPH-dependent 2,4-dienoyl-CoA reductase/sulfur reductase-like enzyme